MQARRARTVALGAAVGGAAGVLFLASPLVLARVVADLPPDDVARMGDLGAAYGGISALLAGVAAGGVAAALIVQIRQFKTSQAQGMRMMQLELMKMLIQEPDLRPTSPSFPEASVETRRRAIFSNLMFRYLELGLEINYFTPESVKADLLEHFQIDEIRALWDKIRTRFAAGVVTAGQHRFMELIESAHQEATESAAARYSALRPSRRRTDRCRAVPIALSLAIGITIGVACRHHAAVVRQRGALMSPDLTPARKSSQDG